MRTKLKAQPEVPADPQPAPDAPLHIAVAPGLLDQQHVVIREQDDTDADYEARCRLLGLGLRVARQD